MCLPIVTFSFPDTMMSMQKICSIHSFIFSDTADYRIPMTFKTTPIFDNAHSKTIKVTFSFPEI